MATPTWARYELTHTTGSGALPASSYPAHMRPQDVPADVGGPALGGWFELGPSSHAVAWMCRPGNRSRGLPLAFLATLACASGTLFFYSLHFLPAWVFVAWLGWDTLKFAATTVWLLLVGLWSLARRAVVRHEPYRP